MNLSDITTQCFILSLFIRDDGERFLLGSGAYCFNEEQLHFTANVFANDIVEVQGNDGVFLAGQVRRPETQVFDGYIGDATTKKQDIETYRRNFLKFFRKNHYYTVVYIFKNGTAIQRQRGFIVDAPQVQELFQLFPAYHIGLSFEDVNYYVYLEDSEGQEIYGKSATIPFSGVATGGGLVWDTHGAKWDSDGAMWEKEGGGGPTTISVDSIDNVYPVWEITGPAVDPKFVNITTNTTISYSGTVSASQVLTIDMNKKTALLNGVSVISNISGGWAYLQPGNNRITYTTTNNNAEASKIYWQEIVG